ncbi:hypothetical protein PAPHI01_2391 [Pancytospora philotis]|nr:hypothetical protein PAPHI01_2391 [Pancytospora philotis]
MALGLFTAIYAAADELGALAGIGACSCGGTGCRIFEKARKIHDAYFLCGSDEAPLERNFEREANNPELGESALVGCIRKMKDTVAKETAWYAQFCNECEELLRLETALRDEALPSYAAPAAVRAPLRPPFNLPARCFKLAVHQISLILRFLDNSPLWAGRLQRRIDDYLADLASEHSRVLHGRPASAEYRAATASLRLYDFFGNLKRSTALPNDYELASKLRAFQQTLIQRGVS